MYRQHFGSKGLLDARVGYIGGDTNSPSYRSVCSGRTGHAEALQVRFDPEKVSYRTLLEFFYKMHDPTTVNRQGPDTGSQYRSGIFYHDEEQERVAKEVTKKVNEEWWKGKVATEVLQAGKWWDAEDYHQKYLDINPGGYECPSQYVFPRFVSLLWEVGRMLICSQLLEEVPAAFGVNSSGSTSSIQMSLMSLE